MAVFEAKKPCYRAIAEDSTSAAAIGKLAGHTNDYRAVADESTLSAAIGKLAGHIQDDHADRVPKSTRRKQESLFVGYDRRLEDTAALKY